MVVAGGVLKLRRSVILISKLQIENVAYAQTASRSLGGRRRHLLFASSLLVGVWEGEQLRGREAGKVVVDGIVVEEKVGRSRAGRVHLRVIINQPVSTRRCFLNFYPDGYALVGCEGEAIGRSIGRGADLDVAKGLVG